MNIYLHWLVLDDACRRARNGEPVFVQVPTPTDCALQAVLPSIITRTMKLISQRGAVVEEQGQMHMVGGDADSDDARTFRPLPAADCA